MARKNDTPQKAAMRELMKGYLKQNDVKNQRRHRCEHHHEGYDVSHSGRSFG